jgi:hypothetical protein
MKLSKPLVAAGILLLAFGSFAATNLVVNGGLFGNTRSSGDGGGGGTGASASASTGKSVYQLLRIAAGQTQDDSNGLGAGNHAVSRIASNAGASGLINPGLQNTNSTPPVPKYDVSFNDGSTAGTTMPGAPLASGRLDGLRNSGGGNNGFSAPTVSPLSASGPTAPVDQTGIDKTTIPTVTPVPEPETYAMLLAGLGLISAMCYRRRSQAKSA